MECNGQNFLPFCTVFRPFISLTIQKIKILKKGKKTIRDIIILHMCTTNDNHMMYGSWDMEHDRHNFLSFWTVFALLPSSKQLKKPKFWKNEKKKKKKMPGDIIILHKCIINDNHVMHGSWDMKRDRYNCLSFWTVFCPFTPLRTWKTEKNNLIYHHFTQM